MVCWNRDRRRGRFTGLGPILLFVLVGLICASEGQGFNPASYFQGKAKAPTASEKNVSPVNIFGFNVPLPNAKGMGIAGDLIQQLSPQNVLKTVIELPNTILKGAEAGQCLLRGFNLLLQKGLFFATHDQKLKSPFNLLPMNQIKKMMNFSIPKADTGDTVESIISVLEYVLSDSPHRAHPFYLKRDAAGLDPYAVAGDILAISISIAGVAASKGEGSPALLLWIIMQKVVGLKIRHQIGYPYGDSVMTASTGMANILAVQMALAVKYPMSMIKGIMALNFEIPGASIMISEGNHDFFKLFGLFPGIPEGMLVRVKMDKAGRMDADDLEKKIVTAKKQKLNPFMIVAVAGSKTLGAIDPIARIADIAEKYDLWLHIDGTHGAPVMFSKTHKAKMKGVERSQSFTWSATSMLGVPAPSSYLITHIENPLQAIWKAESAFEFVSQVGATVASNLFTSPKLTDCAKVWLMWLVKGDKGLAQHVDYSYKVAKTFKDKMKKYKNFRLITNELDTPVVSFNWIPDKWLKEKNSKEYSKKLSAFTERLQVHLLIEGFVYLSTTRLRPDEPKYFIASLTNSIMTNPDMDYILNKIDCHGRMLDEGRLGLCLNATLERAMAVFKMQPSDFMPYVNAAMPDLHLEFFSGLFKLLLKKGFAFIQSLLTGSGNGFSGLTTLPGELADLGLADQGMKQDDFWQYIDHVFEFGLKGMNVTLGAMKFLKGFGCTRVLGGIVTTLMGPIMQNYQSSPVFTMVANELMKIIRFQIGYTNGGGDGAILSADGTLAAMYALTLGKRNYMHTNGGKNSTAGKKKLVFYISEEAFIAWKKGAAAAGFGLENAVYVPADKKTGRMDIKLLKAAIKKTKASKDSAPFMVVATVGTQVLGAIDPLPEILAVCREFKLWFHVDAQNAGAMVLSQKQVRRLKGIEMSDSFAFNPNRFYEDGVDFTILVTRHPKWVESTFGTPLKPKANDGRKEMVIDEEGGDVVTGGRSPDEFTFWLMLKSQGMGGAAREVDNLLNAVQTTLQSMLRRGKFEFILSSFETTTIAFNYLYKEYKDRKSNKTIKAISEDQEKLVGLLKQNKVYDITLVKSLLYFRGQVSFLKLDVTKYDVADLSEIVDKVVAAGRSLAAGAGGKVSGSGGGGGGFSLFGDNGMFGNFAGGWGGGGGTGVSIGGKVGGKVSTSGSKTSASSSNYKTSSSSTSTSSKTGTKVGVNTKGGRGGGSGITVKITSEWNWV